MFSAPFIVGVNVTATVHGVVSLFKSAPHGVAPPAAAAKSPEFPVCVARLYVTFESPVLFVIERDIAGDVVPISTLPKLSVVGDTTTVGCSVNIAAKPAAVDPAG